MVTLAASPGQAAVVSYAQELAARKGTAMNTPLSISSTESPAQDMSTVLLSDVDTAGVFALAAITLPPYDPGAPPHTHPEHSEGCYVLAGTLALTQDQRTITLIAGTAVQVPAGVTHTYWNPTAGPTTILLIYTPGAPYEVVAALAAGRLGVAPPYLNTS
jgi:quercetin dioxygenase-like cupin family protein